MTIADNLQILRARIARATEEAGRATDEVQLVAVSKTFPAEAVVEAAALGLVDFGENRVQEAESKLPAVEAARGAAAPLVWHLVGHLQSNKAAKAVALFDWIHSVDDEALAVELARRAEAAGKRPRILIQVNASGESSKSGCEPERLIALSRRVAALPALSLEGLMTIGPLDPDPESARPAFRLLQRLREEARQATALPLPHLSMGMSGDLEVAIAEGATLIRAGTAIFGVRNPKAIRPGEP